MAHDHHHGHHHHDHSHSPKSFTRAFVLGILLNLAFVAVEAGYGFYANSLALMADAGHNFSDVIGLVLAWGAAWLGTRKPSPRFTYGFGQTSILAALANALLLLAAVGGIVWEGFARLQSPQPVAGGIIVAVAAIGIVINGATALLFVRGKDSDLNVRGAYLHMASDALVSAGVVVAGIVIGYTGWLWLDSAMSIGIGVIILVSTWSLFKDSLKLAMAGVPPGLEVEKVKSFLTAVDGVSSVHDLHVWAMSTTEVALTAHLVIPKGHPGDSFLKKIAHDLEHDFNIHHATLQIELGETSCECSLAPEDSV